MKTVNQHVDPTVFQPIEEPRIKFTQNDNIINEIGEISSKTGYGEAGNVISLPITLSTATLTLQSHDGSPFLLQPSLISCKLSCLGDSQPTKCKINQTHQEKHNITFALCTIEESIN